VPGAMPRNSVERIDGDDLRALASASRALLGSVARDARDQAKVLVDRRRERKGQVRQDPPREPERSATPPPRRRRFKRRWVVVPVLTTVVLVLLLLAGVAVAVAAIFGYL
jgi:eukaryotic-like serine/threonine-protein kinase